MEIREGVNSVGWILCRLNTPIEDLPSIDSSILKHIYDLAYGVLSSYDYPPTNGWIFLAKDPSLHSVVQNLTDEERQQIATSPLHTSLITLNNEGYDLIQNLDGDGSQAPQIHTHLPSVRTGYSLTGITVSGSLLQEINGTYLYKGHFGGAPVYGHVRQWILIRCKLPEITLPVSLFAVAAANRARLNGEIVDDVVDNIDQITRGMNEVEIENRADHRFEDVVREGSRLVRIAGAITRSDEETRRMELRSRNDNAILAQLQSSNTTHPLDSQLINNSTSRGADTLVTDMILSRNITYQQTQFSGLHSFALNPNLQQALPMTNIEHEENLKQIHIQYSNNRSEAEIELTREILEMIQQREISLNELLQILSITNRKYYQYESKKNHLLLGNENHKTIDDDNDDEESKDIEEVFDIYNERKLLEPYFNEFRNKTISFLEAYGAWSKVYLRNDELRKKNENLASLAAIRAETTKNVQAIRQWQDELLATRLDHRPYCVILASYTPSFLYERTASEAAKRCLEMKYIGVYDTREEARLAATRAFAEIPLELRLTEDLRSATPFFESLRPCLQHYIIRTAGVSPMLHCEQCDKVPPHSEIAQRKGHLLTKRKTLRSITKKNSHNNNEKNENLPPFIWRDVNYIDKIWSDVPDGRLYPFLIQLFPEWSNRMPLPYTNPLCLSSNLTDEILENSSYQSMKQQSSSSSSSQPSLLSGLKGRMEKLNDALKYSKKISMISGEDTKNQKYLNHPYNISQMNSSKSVSNFNKKKSSKEIQPLFSQTTRNLDNNWNMETNSGRPSSSPSFNYENFDNDNTYYGIELNRIWRAWNILQRGRSAIGEEMFAKSQKNENNEFIQNHFIETTDSKISESRRNTIHSTTSSSSKKSLKDNSIVSKSSTNESIPNIISSIEEEEIPTTLNGVYALLSRVKKTDPSDIPLVSVEVESGERGVHLLTTQTRYQPTGRSPYEWCKRDVPSRHTGQTSTGEFSGLTVGRASRAYDFQLAFTRTGEEKQAVRKWIQKRLRAILRIPYISAVKEKQLINLLSLASQLRSTDLTFEMNAAQQLKERYDGVVKATPILQALYRGKQGRLLANKLMKERDLALQMVQSVIKESEKLAWNTGPEWVKIGLENATKRRKLVCIRVLLNLGPGLQGLATIRQAPRKYRKKLNSSCPACFFSNELVNDSSLPTECQPTTLQNRKSSRKSSNIPVLTLTSSSSNSKINNSSPRRTVLQRPSSASHTNSPRLSVRPSRPSSPTSRTNISNISKKSGPNISTATIQRQQAAEKAKLAGHKAICICQDIVEPEQWAVSIYEPFSGQTHTLVLTAAAGLSVLRILENQRNALRKVETLKKCLPGNDLTELHNLRPLFPIPPRPSSTMIDTKSSENELPMEELSKLMDSVGAGDHGLAFTRRGLSATEVFSSTSKTSQKQLPIRTIPNGTSHSLAYLQSAAEGLAIPRLPFELSNDLQRLVFGASEGVKETNSWLDSSSFKTAQFPSLVRDFHAITVNDDTETHLPTLEQYSSKLLLPNSLGLSGGSLNKTKNNIEEIIKNGTPDIYFTPFHKLEQGSIRLTSLLSRLKAYDIQIQTSKLQVISLFNRHQEVLLTSEHLQMISEDYFSSCLVLEDQTIQWGLHNQSVMELSSSLAQRTAEEIAGKRVDILHTNDPLVDAAGWRGMSEYHKLQKALKQRLYEWNNSKILAKNGCNAVLDCDMNVKRLEEEIQCIEKERYNTAYEFYNIWKLQKKQSGELKSILSNILTILTIRKRLVPSITKSLMIMPIGQLPDDNFNSEIIPFGVGLGGLIGTPGMNRLTRDVCERLRPVNRRLLSAVNRQAIKLVNTYGNTLKLPIRNSATALATVWYDPLHDVFLVAIDTAGSSSSEGICTTEMTASNEIGQDEKPSINVTEEAVQHIDLDLPHNAFSMLTPHVLQSEIAITRRDVDSILRKQTSSSKSMNDDSTMIKENRTLLSSARSRFREEFIPPSKTPRPLTGVVIHEAVKRPTGSFTQRRKRQEEILTETATKLAESLHLAPFSGRPTLGDIAKKRRFNFVWQKLKRSLWWRSIIRNAPPSTEFARFHATHATQRYVVSVRTSSMDSGTLRNSNGERAGAGSGFEVCLTPLAVAVPLRNQIRVSITLQTFFRAILNGQVTSSYGSGGNGGGSSALLLAAITGRLITNRFHDPIASSILTSLIPSLPGQSSPFRDPLSHEITEYRPSFTNHTTYQGPVGTLHRFVAGVYVRIRIFQSLPKSESGGGHSLSSYGGSLILELSTPVDGLFGSHAYEGKVTTIDFEWPTIIAWVIKHSYRESLISLLHPTSLASLVQFLLDSITWIAAFSNTKSNEMKSFSSIDHNHHIPSNISPEILEAFSYSLKDKNSSSNVLLKKHQATKKHNNDIDYRPEEQHSYILLESFTNHHISYNLAIDLTELIKISILSLSRYTFWSSKRYGNENFIEGHDVLTSYINDDTKNPMIIDGMKSIQRLSNSSSSYTLPIDIIEKTLENLRDIASSPKWLLQTSLGLQDESDLKRAEVFQFVPVANSVWGFNNSDNDSKFSSFDVMNDMVSNTTTTDTTNGIISNENDEEIFDFQEQEKLLSIPPLSLYFINIDSSIDKETASIRLSPISSSTSHSSSVETLLLSNERLRMIYEDHRSIELRKRNLSLIRDYQKPLRYPILDDNQCKHSILTHTIKRFHTSSASKMYKYHLKSENLRKFQFLIQFEKFLLYKKDVLSMKNTIQIDCIIPKPIYDIKIIPPWAIDLASALAAANNNNADDDDDDDSDDDSDEEHENDVKKIDPEEIIEKDDDIVSEENDSDMDSTYSSSSCNQVQTPSTARSKHRKRLNSSNTPEKSSVEVDNPLGDLALPFNIEAWMVTVPIIKRKYASMNPPELSRESSIRKGGFPYYITSPLQDQLTGFRDPYRWLRSAQIPSNKAITTVESRSEILRKEKAKAELNSLYIIDEKLVKVLPLQSNESRREKMMVVRRRRVSTFGITEWQIADVSSATECGAFFMPRYTPLPPPDDPHFAAEQPWAIHAYENSLRYSQGGVSLPSSLTSNLSVSQSATVAETSIKNSDITHTASSTLADLAASSSRLTQTDLTARVCHAVALSVVNQTIATAAAQHMSLARKFALMNSSASAMSRARRNGNNTNLPATSMKKYVAPAPPLSNELSSVVDSLRKVTSRVHRRRTQPLQFLKPVKNSTDVVPSGSQSVESKIQELGEITFSSKVSGAITPPSTSSVMNSRSVRGSLLAERRSSKNADFAYVIHIPADEAHPCTMKALFPFQVTKFARDALQSAAKNAENAAHVAASIAAAARGETLETSKIIPPTFEQLTSQIDDATSNTSIAMAIAASLVSQQTSSENSINSNLSNFLTRVILPHVFIYFDKSAVNYTLASLTTPTDSSPSWDSATHGLNSRVQRLIQEDILYCGHSSSKLSPIVLLRSLLNTTKNSSSSSSNTIFDSNLLSLALPALGDIVILIRHSKELYHRLSNILTEYSNDYLPILKLRKLKFGREREWRLRNLRSLRMTTLSVSQLLLPFIEDILNGKRFTRKIPNSMIFYRLSVCLLDWFDQTFHYRLKRLENHKNHLIYMINGIPQSEVCDGLVYPSYNFGGTTFSIDEIIEKDESRLLPTYDTPFLAPNPCEITYENFITHPYYKILCATLRGRDLSKYHHSADSNSSIQDDPVMDMLCKELSTTRDAVCTLGAYPQFHPQQIVYGAWLMHCHHCVLPVADCNFPGCRQIRTSGASHNQDGQRHTHTPSLAELVAKSNIETTVSKEVVNTSMSTLVATSSINDEKTTKLSSTPSPDPFTGWHPVDNAVKSFLQQNCVLSASLRRSLRLPQTAAISLSIEEEAALEAAADAAAAARHERRLALTPDFSVVAATSELLETLAALLVRPELRASGLGSDALQCAAGGLTYAVHRRRVNGLVQQLIDLKQAVGKSSNKLQISNTSGPPISPRVTRSAATESSAAQEAVIDIIDRCLRLIDSHGYNEYDGEEISVGSLDESLNSGRPQESVAIASSNIVNGSSGTLQEPLNVGFITREILQIVEPLCRKVDLYPPLSKSGKLVASKKDMPLPTWLLESLMSRMHLAATHPAFPLRCHLPPSTRGGIGTLTSQELSLASNIHLAVSNGTPPPPCAPPQVTKPIYDPNDPTSPPLHGGRFMCWDRLLCEGVVHYPDGNIIILSVLYGLIEDSSAYLQSDTYRSCPVAGQRFVPLSSVGSLTRGWSISVFDVTSCVMYVAPLTQSSLTRFAETAKTTGKSADTLNAHDYMPLAAVFLSRAVNLVQTLRVGKFCTGIAINIVPDSSLRPPPKLVDPRYYIDIHRSGSKTSTSQSIDSRMSLMADFLDTLE